MPLHPTGGADRRRPDHAQDVLDTLRAALTYRGLILPSLELDPVTTSSRYYPLPLINLGRVSLDTATALADSLYPLGGQR
jgi:hypothetical protein